MRSSKVHHAARCLTVTLALVIHLSAYAQMDWTETSDLSDTDKAAIGQLAQNVYLNAIKASVIHHFPRSEKSFAIRGQVFANGARRAWQERWRFSDGDWFVDVELGTGISYAEAETIVLAIRRKSLQSTPDLETYRNFDASSIRSIQTTDPLAREFIVEIGGSGSGQSLSVRLQGGEVMLYEFAFWDGLKRSWWSNRYVSGQYP